MTPEEAQALEPGLTPGGWNVDVDEYGDEILSILAVIHDGKLIRGRRVAEEIDNPHDARLIAAAPDMRATIADLQWEWGLDVNGSIWWMNDQEMAEDALEGVQAGTIVRRLVGPVEVVDPS